MALGAAPRHPEHEPLDAEEHQDPGGGDLPGQLRQRIQFEAVVQRADEHDQPTGDDHRQGVVGVGKTARQRRQVGGQEHRREHSAVHRDATHPRHRRDVHVAHPGVGDRTDPDRQQPDQSGQQESRRGGGEQDQQVFTGGKAGRGPRCVVHTGGSPARCRGPREFDIQPPERIDQARRSSSLSTLRIRALTLSARARTGFTGPLRAPRRAPPTGHRGSPRPPAAPVACSG